MYKQKYVVTVFLLLVSIILAVNNNFASAADIIKSDAISIPKLLNYQGKLTNLAGNPVIDSIYSITFRLFNSSSGGSSFWTETQNVQTNSGLFNVLLGSTNQIDTIPQAGICYLEIQINPNPAMTPRIRLVSAAYAYLAQKADTAGYAPLSRPISPGIGTIELADGAVTNAKLGSNVVTTDKIQDGTIQVADLSFIPVTRPLTPGVSTSEIQDGAVSMPKINQSGATTGQVIKWTGSTWAPGSDSAGGSPSGTAGGDLTGTYPNPSISANAVNSAKILDNSIRGADIAKPCTLYAATLNPLLDITNIGDGDGIKITRNATAATNPSIIAYNYGSGAAIIGNATADDAGTAGIVGNHSGHRPAIFGYTGTIFPGIPNITAGLSSCSDSGYGIYVPFSKYTGILCDTVGHVPGGPYYTAIYVNNGAWNGIGVSSCSLDAFVTDDPNRDGYSVWGTTGRNGLYVNRADSDGVHISDAGRYGMWVEQSARNGIRIDTTYAGYWGVYVHAGGGAGVGVDKTVNGPGYYIGNAAWDGLQVGNAGDDGVYIGNAGDNGFNVNSANLDGVNIGHAGSDGIEIGNTSLNGINIDSTYNYGMYIRRANQDGFWVNNAGDDGFYVSNAGGEGYYAGVTGANGFYASNTGTNGMYIGNTGADGLHIYHAGDDGIEIDSCYWYGLWVNGCQYGVVVDDATSRGISISNAGSYGTYANSNDGRGGYFRNNNNSYYALYAINNTGTGGTVKGLYVQGNGYATGGFSSFLTDGKTGFSLTSPDKEVMISGSSSLADGYSTINFDQSLHNVFSENIPLKVIITPTSECNGVFVSNKSASGFTVKELSSGCSNATFDWIAIGRIKGYEQTPYIASEAPVPPEVQTRKPVHEEPRQIENIPEPRIRHTQPAYQQNMNNGFTGNEPINTEFNYKSHEQDYNNSQSSEEKR